MNPKGIPQRDLSGYFWLIISLVVVVCAIIFIAFSQNKFETTINATFEKEQQHHIHLLQSLIRDHVNKSEQNLKHIAQMVKPILTDHKAIESLLKNFTSTHKDSFYSLMLADIQGKVISSSTAFFPGMNNLFEFVDIDENDAQENRSRSFLSERIFSEERKPSTLLFVQVFADSEKEHEQFYIVGELNLKIYVDRQLDYIQGEPVYFVLSDNDGEIYSIINIAHKNLPEMEKGSLFPLDTFCLRCHTKDSFDDFQESIRTGELVQTLYKSPYGEVLKRTVSTIQVLNETWVLSLSQPHSLIQDKINRNFRDNVIAVLLLILFLIGGIVFSNKQRARQALSEDYRRLINNLNVGIMRVDSSGSILNMNEAMLSLLEYDGIDQISATNIKNIFRRDSKWQEITAKLEEKTGILEGDFQVKKRDGNLFQASLFMRTVRDKHDDIIYIDGVLQDVTDKKHAEEERLRISRLESIELLAGGIAHDFNNLLTAIVGSISLSRLAKDPKEQNTILQKAEKACFRAQSLTQQLLTFSKGGTPVQTADSIERVIRDSGDFVLHGSNCNIIYNFAPDLKLVNIDSEQIEQVIQNLVINAIQAMPDGGTIRIEAVNKMVDGHRQLTSGEYVQITVDDKGQGITPEIAEQVFDPYFTTKRGGSGLGLAVCYSVIKKHKGTISIKSLPGQGATITFYLPVAEDKKRKDTDQDIEELIRGNGTVLVIDDDPHVADTMVSFLEELGYIPTYVESGEKAFSLLQNDMIPYDLIITDLTIPGGMGGLEIKEKIRKIDPAARIIVASGYYDDPVMSEYEKHGFNGAIKKPFRINTVSTELHKVLQS